MKFTFKLLCVVLPIVLFWLGFFYLIAKNKKVVVVSSERVRAEAYATPHSVVEVKKSNNVRDPRPERKLGYLVALKYYEQQTQASRNFLQWQCLGSAAGLRVVEPFIYRSNIGFPFSEMSSTKGASLPMRYGTLIDMSLWNKETSDIYNYPTVATWEDLLAEAPRNVIIVCARYRNPPTIKVPVPGHNYQQGCSKACFHTFNSSLTYLKSYGFQLVNKVCANFAGYAGSIREENFIRDVLGAYKNDDVTILLNEFRGFFGLYRMPVLSPCGIIHSIMNVSTVPSPQLLKDALHYSMVNFKGEAYTSVLVRIEKIILHSRRNVTLCAQETLSILQKLRNSKKLVEVFLAMDVGKFGSKGSRLHNLQSYGETFFRLLYSTKWSFEDWERSFSIASSTNPAYIANFQRTVAAKAECMVMVGAGGFQGQARNLYDRYHKERSTRCVYKVCSEPL